MLTGRITDQVVELAVTPLPDGAVELTVVSVDASGTHVTTVERGDDHTLRARARQLAAQHDLAPAWADHSWVQLGARPPAPRYVLR
ncbi:MAG: hypothetical protein ACKO04_02600 [Actinomycetes bacterium]